MLYFFNLEGFIAVHELGQGRQSRDQVLRFGCRSLCGLAQLITQINTIGLSNGLKVVDL